MLSTVTFAVVVASILVTCLSGFDGNLIPPVVSEEVLQQKQYDKRELEFYAEPSTWQENGVPGDVNVYPSYEERALGTWLNVVCFNVFYSPL